MIWKQTLKYVSGVVLGLLLVPAVAMAAQSASNSYQVNEVFFGSGGNLNSCSTTFCSKQSAGELTTGNTKSASFQAQGGFNTDRTPYIQFVVSNTNVNLGSLSPSSTATANSTFTVKTYLAHGYAVINASDPPTNSSYIMQAPTIPTAPAVGTEQFGINLVANTSPASFGTNPVQVPDSTFAFGQVAASYNTANMYKYVKGDTVAFSNSSTSSTSYTVSYIFNISHVTPGGTYVLHHVLVATGTY